MLDGTANLWVFVAGMGCLCGISFILGRWSVFESRRKREEREDRRIQRLMKFAVLEFWDKATPALALLWKPSPVSGGLATDTPYPHFADMRGLFKGLYDEATSEAPAGERKFMDQADEALASLRPTAEHNENEAVQTEKFLSELPEDVIQSHMKRRRDRKRREEKHAGENL